VRRRVVREIRRLLPDQGFADEMGQVGNAVFRQAQFVSSG
jgi:hypothetical protein